MSVAPLVEVVGLCKRYPVVGHRGDRLRALWDVLRGRPPRRVATVLDQVSFEVRPGESLAIIGENGAGKSTLLKLITGVLTPSSGIARTRGRVGALLELGAGFHPEYSGRENVRMAAALYGLHGRALEEKLPEIAAFADLGDYLDEPVKHYSSGMVVRLGFAVIAAVRPELLITDEVLAVGDESFQKKCIRWLDEYLAGGGTLLLVSHSMYHVQKLCRRALWLHRGRVEAIGEVFDVTQRYLAWHERRQAKEASPGIVRGDLEYSIRALALNGDGGDAPLALRCGDALVVDVTMGSRDDRAPALLVGIVRADGTPVYGVSTDMDGVAVRRGGVGEYHARLVFDPLDLLPGSYRLRAHPLDPEGLRLFDTAERAIEIRGESRELGLVRLPHRWENHTA
ncbi:ATP-binding cassette domain-containing protein [Rehaibacterium terrae]|uniref:Lipopolysaccharide transport system ATP-binding protein n=1 Tax=Rehaibacterium terrae TaxID=1341696 RepID=A0A7W7V7E6_9GAMM|nr:lipopolysaccharide transport system ATP-binding protein [Rehaibacterium terrae]